MRTIVVTSDPPISPGMMDLCSPFVALLLFVVPPAAICWTASVTAKRYLCDRPVGVRRVIDACATGCWLQFMWLFMALSTAIVIGGATAIPFLALSGAFDLFPLALAVVTLAVGGVIGLVTWQLFWPILSEEWRRLTATDASFDDRAGQPTS